MRKFLSLLVVLLTTVTSAWADAVTLNFADGTLSNGNKVLTMTDASSGTTVTLTASDGISKMSGQFFFDGTCTITASVKGIVSKIAINYVSGSQEITGAGPYNLSTSGGDLYYNEFALPEPSGITVTYLPGNDYTLALYDGKAYKYYTNVNYEEIDLSQFGGALTVTGDDANGYTWKMKNFTFISTGVTAPLAFESNTGKDFHLVLEGNNTIIGSAESSSTEIDGLDIMSGNAFISGTGTLTVSAGNNTSTKTGACSIGIYVEKGSLTIDGATVKTTAGSVSSTSVSNEITKNPRSLGIVTANDLYVKNGAQVEAMGNTAYLISIGAMCQAGHIYISGSNSSLTGKSSSVSFPYSNYSAAIYTSTQSDVIAKDASGNVLTANTVTGMEGYSFFSAPDVLATTATLTAVPFSDFKIDFRVHTSGTQTYTVVTPASGVLPSKISDFNAGTPASTYNQHGTQNASFKVAVDGPVKFMIGGCEYTNGATVSVNGGAAIAIDTKSAGCENSVSSIETATYNKYATYIYNNEEPATLTFNLGDYCPYIIALAYKTVGTEADLTTAISNAQAGETIQLTGDINLTSELSIAADKDFTLDLNGHVLKQTAQASVISNKGTLAIADNSAAKTGQITGGHPTNVGGGIYNEGTLNITGGTITGNTAGASGGGIYNRVNNSSAATVNMTGGKITGNKAGTNGGGILNNQGTVTLKDVTISKNAAKRGGAIYSTLGSSAVTVEDGTISENSAEHEGGIANFATLKLIGTNQCTITGNTSTMSDYPSGGVQIYLYDQTVTLKGKVIIKDNTTDGKTANLCLNGYPVPQQITLDGLTAGSEIGVTTMVGNNNVGYTVGAYQFTTNGSADDMQYFFSDDDTYAFLYNTDHLETSLIKRGDADVDAEFTVNDYNKVKNYILTPATTPAYPTKNVLFLNADANDSKAIDASDLTVIVDGIYNDAANKAKAIQNSKFKIQNYVAESVDGFNVAVSGNTLTISADNASAFLAAQMDIMLPEGVTIASAQSAGHTVYNKVQEDGSTRVLIAGLQNNQFAGSAVATLTLSGNVDSNTSTSSAQAVDVNNAIFTNTAFQSVAATASSTTGITSYENETLRYENENRKFIENGKVVILKNGKKYTTAGQIMK